MRPVVTLHRQSVASAMLIAGACAAVGCGERADFVVTAIEPVSLEGRFEGVNFDAGLRLRGVQAESVLYQVRVLDSSNRAVLSSDGTYENDLGEVAGSRALTLGGPDWVVPRARVTLPLEQLELREDHLPVFAEFSIVKSTGEVIGRKVEYLPIQPARDGWRWAAGEPPAEAPRVAAVRQPRETIRPPRGESRERPSTPAGDAPVAQASPSTPRSAATQPAPRVAAADNQRRASGSPPSSAGTAPPSTSAAPSSAAPRTATARPPAAAAPTPRAEPANPTAAARPSTPPPATRLAPQPSPRAARPPQRVYVVQRGDTLSTIALRFYGDADRWEDIYELNRAVLRSPHGVREGMVLRLPLQAPASAPSRP